MATDSLKKVMSVSMDKEVESPIPSTASSKCRGKFSG